jgi:hypothetical protein
MTCQPLSFVPAASPAVLNSWRTGSAQRTISALGNRQGTRPRGATGGAGRSFGLYSSTCSSRTTSRQSVGRASRGGRRRRIACVEPSTERWGPGWPSTTNRPSPQTNARTGARCVTRAEFNCCVGHDATLRRPIASAVVDLTGIPGEILGIGSVSRLAPSLERALPANEITGMYSKTRGMSDV